MELLGSFNSWKEPIIMQKNDRGTYFCRVKVDLGLMQFKFRLNDSVWSITSAVKVKKDDYGNSNNFVEVVQSSFIHDDFVDLRKRFASLKLKLGRDFKKMHIETVTEDVCVVKRLCKSYGSSYVLITRLNYDPNAQPIDFNYELPGWVYKVKSMFYFEKDVTLVDSEIPRLKCRIIEKSDFSQFGYVWHR